MGFNVFIKDVEIVACLIFSSIQKALSDMSGKTTLLPNKSVCTGLWYQKGNVFGVSFWEGKTFRILIINEQ